MSKTLPMVHKVKRLLLRVGLSLIYENSPNRRVLYRLKPKVRTRYSEVVGTIIRNVLTEIKYRVKIFLQKRPSSTLSTKVTGWYRGVVSGKDICGRVKGRVEGCRSVLDLGTQVYCPKGIF